MPLMTRDHVGEGSNGHRMIIGDPAPEPGFTVQAAEEQEVRPADELELLHETVQPACVEVSDRDIGVLVEAGQGGRIVAGEAKGAGPEDPLAIDEMSDNLLDAPGIGACRVSASASERSRSKATVLSICNVSCVRMSCSGTSLIYVSNGGAYSVGSGLDGIRVLMTMSPRSA